MIAGLCLAISLNSITAITQTSYLNLCCNDERLKVSRFYFEQELPKAEYKEMSLSDLMRWNVFKDLPNDARELILTKFGGA